MLRKTKDLITENKKQRGDCIVLMIVTNRGNFSPIGLRHITFPRTKNVLEKIFNAIVMALTKQFFTDVIRDHQRLICHLIIIILFSCYKLTLILGY